MGMAQSDPCSESQHCKHVGIFRKSSLEEIQGHSWQMSCTLIPYRLYTCVIPNIHFKATKLKSCLHVTFVPGQNGCLQPWLVLLSCWKSNNLISYLGLKHNWTWPTCWAVFNLVWALLLVTLPGVNDKLRSDQPHWQENHSEDVNRHESSWG